jgi:hypothetical protein
MFLTDFSRISISRSVAMLRAFVGAAPSGDGWDAARTRLRLASIGDNNEAVLKKYTSRGHPDHSGKL